MSDIFINYAHIDNQPFTEGQRGWMARVHQNLETRLSQLPGERPIIWRDPKLTCSDIFGDAILKGLLASKVMLPVVSPRCLKSEWRTRGACRKIETPAATLQRHRTPGQALAPVSSLSSAGQTHAHNRQQRRRP